MLHAPEMHTSDLRLRIINRTVKIIFIEVLYICQYRVNVVERIITNSRKLKVLSLEILKIIALLSKLGLVGVLE